MDDTFLLFNSPDHVNKFYNYINSRHVNMNFTFEVESDNCLSFLDILISRENNKLHTSVYRKPTFSGLYSNFSSFMPMLYKKGLLKTLLYRAFMLKEWRDKAKRKSEGNEQFIYKVRGDPKNGLRLFRMEKRKDLPKE